MLVSDFVCNSSPPHSYHYSSDGLSFCFTIAKHAYFRASAVMNFNACMLFPNSPNVCYSQIVLRLAHSLPSGFCSETTFSVRASLFKLFNFTSALQHFIYHLLDSYFFLSTHHSLAYVYLLIFLTVQSIS